MARIRRICRLLALATTMLAGAASGDALLDARVAQVIDGDSLRVELGDGRAEEVRLYGMDAPERRQVGGREASRALSGLVGGRAVQLMPVTRDRYGRLVAVLLVDGDRVNERMIEGGHAWAYRRYLHQLEGAAAWCDLEAAARQARRGLWARPDPRPPWATRNSGPDVAELSVEACRAAIPERGPGRRVGRRARTDQPAALEVAPTIGAREAARDGCLIKGNINGRGERIYHLPGTHSWETTRIDPAHGERWFCSEEEARAAGWRPPR